MFHVSPQILRALPFACLLIGLLLVGSLVIAAYRRKIREGAQTDEEMLADFQAAYDAGEMGEEEFRRVRDLISDRPSKPVEARKPRPSIDTSGWEEDSIPPTGGADETPHAQG